MASDETIATRFPMPEVEVLVDGYDTRHDDDVYYGDGSELDADDHTGIRVSRLSIETSEGDADSELSSDGKKEKMAAFEEDDDDDFHRGINYLSLPGTPTRSTPRRRAQSTRPAWVKDYASETEARAPQSGRGRKKAGSGGGGGGGGDRDRSSHCCRSSRRARDSRVDRAWEMRRCHCAGDGGADSHSGGSSPCVVVRPRGRGTASMCMDMDEVKACRDLGLELPCDWTVEIPPVAFHWPAAAPDTSSGGDSPGRISSPGDDPRDMKARLRVWAQAVALASASRLSS